MTTEPSHPCRYIDGPLKGQEADSARPPYRDPDGVAMAAGFGDRRLMHGRWQPGENGIYSRTERGYEWSEAPAPRQHRRPLPGPDSELTAILARVAATEHYRIRDGKLLHSRDDGRPLTEERTARRARQLAARLGRLPASQSEPRGEDQPEDGN